MTGDGERHAVRLRVNGDEVQRTVDTRLLLSDFLRHELGLTGTHVGCEHGVCGACTVMIDAEIRAALAGNLCRCTGYQGLVAATRAALRDALVRQARPLEAGPKQDR